MNPKQLSNPWSRRSETNIRRFQAELLRRYLRDVVLPLSPRYRDLFKEHSLDADSIRTLDDLKRIPFTSKTDLLPTPENPARFKDFILQPDKKTLARRPGTILHALLHGRKQAEEDLAAEYRPAMLFFTTGRAAEPLAFALTNHDLGNLAAASRRLMEVCAARPEFRMLNAFPFAPHLAFWFTHHAGLSFNVLTVSSGGGKVMGTEGNLRLLRKLSPDVVIGVPTFIYHLLQQAVSEGVWCANLQRIVLGGEKVSSGLRLKLRDLAAQLGANKTDILATYGFTEAKLAWAECPFPADQPSGGYHLYPELGIIEIVDSETGEPVPSGHPGEIVFTPLDARGSVVLRYRTGDFIDGGLHYEPCPHCGRSIPRLVGRISRASEVKEMHLGKLKGTLIDFNQLEHVLDDAPRVSAWQLELRKLNDDPHEVDELILHVQKAYGTDETQLRNELNDRFHSYTEIRPNQIVFHSVEEIRRLLGVGVQIKEQKIVDHRPRSDDSAPLKPVAPNKTQAQSEPAKPS